MKNEHLRILATVESMLIWDRVAETGLSKSRAVAELYNEGKLSEWSYCCSCPYCQYFACYNCPWPGSKNDPEHRYLYKCCANDSPFKDYVKLTNDADRMAAARQVFEFIENIDI